MGLVTTRYSWGDDSPVRKVEIVTSPDGMKKSLNIHAGAQVERGGLAKIPGALSRYGFSNVYADVVNGENVLVVDGVKEKDTPKLVAALNNLGITKGDPQTEHFNVTLKKGTASEFLKRNALNINGVFGVTGHAAMMGTGILQNDKDRMWNGILGGMVPLLLGVCGNGKREVDFEPVFEGMRQYFEAEGLQLPIFTEKHKQGLTDTIKHFVAEHPVPIAYTIGLTAGYKGVKSAWNQVSKGQGGHARLGAISTSQIGNLIVLGVPEKDKTLAEKDQHKDTSLGHEIAQHFKEFARDPVEALRSAPMFWDGTLKFFDNILYGMDTHDEIKKVRGKWAHNRDTKDYKELAEKITARLKQLDIHVDRDLATIIVPSGRPSGKFGGIIKALEGEESILKTLRNAQGFGDATLRHRQILNHFGSVGDKEKTLLHDMENFARMEEECRIAESKLGRLSPWLAGVTAVTFTIATAMEAFASKGRDASYMQEDMYNKMYALAAKTLNDVATEDREFVMGKMAGYLAGLPDVHNAGITSEKITEEISKRLNAIDNSPWVIHSSTHIQQALRPQTPGDGQSVHA